MTLQVVEEVGAAAQLVQASNAVWIAPPQIIAQDLKTGMFRDLGVPDGIEAGKVKLSYYSVERRTPSPAASELQDAFQLALST